MKRPNPGMTLLKRRLLSMILFAFGGCGTDPASFIVAPRETDAVSGGITNLQPYMGRLQSSANASSDMGQFMLASCGCGDWRVLLIPNDGNAKTQFPVTFYSNGDYQPTGEVAVYALDGQTGFSGMVDQDAGTLSGRALNGSFRAFVSATRGGDVHAQPVDACVLCHLGDDPVLPLPDWHVTNYYDYPEVCLHCHSANGQ